MSIFVKMYKKERLIEYLSKPDSVRTATKGAYLFGVLTAIGVGTWILVRWWGTDYAFFSIAQGFIVWRLWKGYKGVV